MRFEIFWQVTKIQNRVIKSNLCNKEVLNYEMVHHLNFQATCAICKAFVKTGCKKNSRSFTRSALSQLQKRDHGGPTNTISQAIFNASFHGTICTVEQPTNI